MGDRMQRGEGRNMPLTNRGDGVGHKQTGETVWATDKQGRRCGPRTHTVKRASVNKGSHGRQACVKCHKRLGAAGCVWGGRRQ